MQIPGRSRRGPEGGREAVLCAAGARPPSHAGRREGHREARPAGKGKRDGNGTPAAGNLGSGNHAKVPLPFPLGVKEYALRTRRVLSLRGNTQAFFFLADSGTN